MFFSDSVFRLVFNKLIVSKISVALKDLYAVVSIILNVNVMKYMMKVKRVNDKQEGGQY
jgi:hypothetical protein